MAEPDPGDDGFRSPPAVASDEGRWEVFPHTADVGVRGYGPTLEAAFAQAALALTSVAVDPAAVRPEVPVPIRCVAPERELLLYEWLNALVYEMVTRRMLFSRFEVTFTGAGLEGTAWGEPIDRARHRPAVEVKGATLTALAVGRAPEGGWTVQCVVDV